MTQEEKAKAYDKALERARKLKENPKAIFFEEKNVHVSDYIFPELAESEGERIRKALIENFKWYCGDFLETTKWGKDDNLLVKDIIAWLEKQGENLANSARTCKEEQKTAWSEEDENVLEDIEEAIMNYWHGDTQDILLDWLKSIKQRMAQ